MEGHRMTSQPLFPSLPPRRILVRGVNWLGDAVMTTPALLRLRERFPEAHITLLAPKKLHELWRHHPAIHEAIAIEPGEGLFSVGRKLRKNQFDLALVLPNSPRAALEVWLAKIPQRVGYARPWRNGFLTHAIPTHPGHAQMRKRSAREIQRLIGFPAGSPPPATRNPHYAPAHQLHEYLHLVAALGAHPEPLAPILAVTPEEITAARRKFGLDQISNPLFGLNPGAAYGPAKRWPTGRFIAAARAIQQRANCVWLIFGGAADIELATRLADGIAQPANLAGKTSMRELMALLKSCRVLLTNDTGPMHIAAALGTAVVVPFGSTSPELTGPGLPGDLRHRLIKSDAPCSPCFLRECPIDFRCMKGISVERVVEAVVEASKR